MAVIGERRAEGERRRDRVFEESKVESLLREARSLAATCRSAQELDRLADGEDLVPVLSLQRLDGDWIAPDHPLSRNRSLGRDWKWMRRFRVSPLAATDAGSRDGTGDLRWIQVELYVHDGDRSYVLCQERSELVAVGRPVGADRRVVEVYVIAIANLPIPGCAPDEVEARVGSWILDFEARNPGIALKPRWIRRLSYGRDPYYAPELVPGTDRDWTWLQPVGRGGGSGLRLAGRHRGPDGLVDGAPLADSRNHAMRLPEELRQFEERVRAGDEDPEEPTLRLLLERLLEEPERYHGALLLNLHGSLLPLPPLRNVSDPVRSPARSPGLRVVTHPERLFTSNGVRDGRCEDLRLRVYAWRQVSSEPSADAFCDGRPILIRFPGLDLRSEDWPIQVEFLEGGVDRGDGLLRYEPFATAANQPTGPYSAWYRLRHETGPAGGPGTTILELHGTPSRCPPVDGAGLRPEDRLYGLAYVPCPTEAGADFSRDLSARGAGPKNTARWRITLPATLLRERVGLAGGKAIEVVTSLGPEPARDRLEESRTWAWYGPSREVVPYTERFQFQGDPRHCPYADLMDGGDGFASGYNWFFDDLVDGTESARGDWPALGRAVLADGWRGRVPRDVPRFFAVLREALARSEATWIQVAGPTALAVGFGGELTAPRRLAGLDAIVDDLAEAEDRLCLGESVAVDEVGGWRSMDWLGELYPDEGWEAWRRDGNLPRDRYRLLPRAGLRGPLPRGTRFGPASRTLGFEGGTSLLNCGTEWETFHHQEVANPRAVTTASFDELRTRWSIELPARLEAAAPVPPRDELARRPRPRVPDAGLPAALGRPPAPGLGRPRAGRPGPGPRRPRAPGHGGPGAAPAQRPRAGSDADRGPRPRRRLRPGEPGRGARRARPAPVAVAPRRPPARRQRGARVGPGEGSGGGPA
ncbi:MAG: hypothetical protein R3F30_13040 [Planctomycetota bacterium]